MQSTNGVLTARFEEAVAYASTLHAEQVRKGTSIPYIPHLLAVCSLVLEDGGDEDEAIVALLHDAVEDQGGRPTLEEIQRRFGDRVARIARAAGRSQRQSATIAGYSQPGAILERRPEIRQAIIEETERLIPQNKRLEQLEGHIRGTIPTTGVEEEIEVLAKDVKDGKLRALKRVATFDMLGALTRLLKIRCRI
jgi:hypothetical protein